MLLEYAKRANCQFAGSTSSLTGILAQIYLLLSEEKYVNLSNLSDEFEGAVSSLPNRCTCHFSDPPVAASFLHTRTTRPDIGFLALQGWGLCNGLRFGQGGEHRGDRFVASSMPLFGSLALLARS